MSEESEGESAATTNGGDGDGDSSAKRRLRNRRLNLNKLARDGILNDVTKSQDLYKFQPILICWLFTNFGHYIYPLYRGVLKVYPGFGEFCS